jgi:chromate transporter
MIMILLELFLVFVQIGFTSFGGMSMIPLIKSEMLGRAWMTATEVMDIVAIAEMTPGPLGINCATFAGIRVAGIAGALCATLGVLVPTLTLCLIAGLFFERFKQNKIVKNMMYGVRPVTIGLVLATIITLSGSSYLVSMVPHWQSIAIGAIIAILIWKWRLSVPKVILISAGLGLLLVR